MHLVYDLYPVATRTGVRVGGLFTNNSARPFPCCNLHRSAGWGDRERKEERRKRMALIKCWCCNAEIDDTLMECPHCKMPVITFPVVGQEPKKTHPEPEGCRQCGRPLPANSVFCPFCGMPVMEEETEENAEDEDTTIVEAVASPENDVSRKIGKIRGTKQSNGSKRITLSKKRRTDVILIACCLLITFGLLVGYMKSSYEPPRHSTVSSSTSFSSSKPKTNTSTSNSSSSGNTSSASSSYKPSTISTPRHTEEDICYCATVIVESYLPTPSTAKFCMYSEMTTQDLGNNHYQCTGWVDCENLYGAMVRYNFIAYYTAEGNGFKEGGAELFLQGY